MNTEDINKLVTTFIDKIDLRKGRKGIHESWKEYSKECLASAKPKKKNAYLFYVDAKRDGLKEKNPDLPYKDIALMLSSGWSDLKKLDNDEYKSYCEMSRKFTVDNTVYEVSKPFHKFSLEFRHSVEDEFTEYDAQQITDVLIERWKSLSNTEKYEWNI